MDKKQMEELMAKRTAPAIDRQVVKAVDLLKPATPGQDRGQVPQETVATHNQTTEAVNISTAKAPSIQDTMNDDSVTARRRGRPRSTTEGLVHFSTWLPEELTWQLRARAVALHKKDYEVVTEALETYLESQG